MAMWRLRRLLRRIVTRGAGLALALAAVAALVVASLVALPAQQQAPILAGVAVLLLASVVLLAGRLVTVSEDFAKESLQHDRIAQALPALYREVEPRLPLPPVEGWALDPRVLVLVIRTMRARRPGAIVEFGGGISTLLIGQVAHEIGARVYSFEHDAEWSRRVQAWIGQWGLDGVAEIHHAPLRHDARDGRTWYDRDVVAAALPAAGIGLVLVDGPPLRAAHAARAGALPAVIERLAEDATVFVDDYGRPQERGIVSDWCAAYPQLRLETIALEREVAIFTSYPQGLPWVRDD